MKGAIERKRRASFTLSRWKIRRSRCVRVEASRSEANRIPLDRANARSRSRAVSARTSHGGLFLEATLSTLRAGIADSSVQDFKARDDLTSLVTPRIESRDGSPVCTDKAIRGSNKSGVDNPRTSCNRRRAKPYRRALRHHFHELEKRCDGKDNNKNAARKSRLLTGVTSCK